MLKLQILSGLIVILAVIGLSFPGSVGAFDMRAQKLETYLEKHNSPLANEAEIFVAEADKNKLDYRLLVAISGVESTFAKQYVVGTYNAWGWGGGYLPFNNWSHAISSISAQLTKAPYRGVEPEILAPIYCPPSYLHWAASVRYFMDKIESTEVADGASLALAITL